MSQHDHEETSRGVDPRVYMEALVGEMRLMMRTEVGLICERLDRVVNANRGQPQMDPNLCRRERVQRAEVRVDDKGKATIESRNRDIKCFTCFGYGHTFSQCPNNRAMFISTGEVEIECKSKKEEKPPLDDANVKNVEYPVVAESLVAKRNEETLVKEDAPQLQQTNIFHARCNACDDVIIKDIPTKRSHVRNSKADSQQCLDSRTNPFEEGGNDTIRRSSTRQSFVEVCSSLNGPRCTNFAKWAITRSKLKRMQGALTGLAQEHISAQSTTLMALTYFRWIIFVSFSMIICFISFLF
jgi:hypothetical protein